MNTNMIRFQWFSRIFALCILVLWMIVASALEGLTQYSSAQMAHVCQQAHMHEHVNHVHPAEIFTCLTRSPQGYKIRALQDKPINHINQKEIFHKGQRLTLGIDLPCRKHDTSCTLLCLTLPMLRLLLSKGKGCRDFLKPSKPCHVGIHWIALAENSQMSTQSLALPVLRLLLSKAQGGKDF